MHWDFWNWRFVRQQGPYRYYEHSRTGARKAKSPMLPVYIPMQSDWLLGGEFVDGLPELPK